MKSRPYIKASLLVPWIAIDSSISYLISESLWSFLNWLDIFSFFAFSFSFRKSINSAFSSSDFDSSNLTSSILSAYSLSKASNLSCSSFVITGFADSLLSSSFKASTLFKSCLMASTAFVTPSFVLNSAIRFVDSSFNPEYLARSSSDLALSIPLENTFSCCIA